MTQQRVFFNFDTSGPDFAMFQRLIESDVFFIPHAAYIMPAYMK